MDCEDSDHNALTGGYVVISRPKETGCTYSGKGQRASP